METSGSGKSGSFSIKYNANNEEIEEVLLCDDDPPTPQFDSSLALDNSSPKKFDKSASIIDKYFKNIRTDKLDKVDDIKKDETKEKDEPSRSSSSKEASSSPTMKDYLSRIGKRGNSADVSYDSSKEQPTETWKIFHDFKFKFSQAVEDIKASRAGEENKPNIPRENSISDSEENSAARDLDQSVGDTDNQVSSLDSSLQNLSEMTQPVTARANEGENTPPHNNPSDSSDDTHRNLIGETQSAPSRINDPEANEDLLEVESGVEALEEDLEQPIATILPDPVTSHFSRSLLQQSLASVISTRQKKLDKPEQKPEEVVIFTFSILVLSLAVLISMVLLSISHIVTGFLLGVWFVKMFGRFYLWVTANYINTNEEKYKFKRSAPQDNAMMYVVPPIKEHRPVKKYEGWINQLKSKEYDPFTYQIGKTATAFLKLEGSQLRVSYTKSRVPKRELWDEQLGKVSFYQHRLYNLLGAKVLLLPKGLVKKRQWSKKYPICIILNEQKVEVFQKESTLVYQTVFYEKEKKTEVEKETAEASQITDATKQKKKFVWRRTREKGTANTKDLKDDADKEGREGLRQRIVRKMHKDKKTSASPSTDHVAISPSQQDKDKEGSMDSNPETEVVKSLHEIKENPTDEQLDDRDYNRIKDLLEETDDMEPGPETPSETEWSVHYKESRETRSKLFIFTRTSRDKLEWYRRFQHAVLGAGEKVPEEQPTEENAGPSETTTEMENEMSAHKLPDKEAVAYTKIKDVPMTSEPLTYSSASSSIANATKDPTTHEKLFWPWMFQILQKHEQITPRTHNAATMCQLTNTLPWQKRGKKAKNAQEEKLPVGSCTSVPMDLAWLNAFIARVIFDAVRDPRIVSQLQVKVQRKLNTLKLPTFISGLEATEICLGGTSPLLTSMTGPLCDERGLWFDADFFYDGGATITLITRVNLMKLKDKTTSVEEQMKVLGETNVDDDLNSQITLGSFPTPPIPPRRRMAAFDSDVEDSAESSSDDEAHSPGVTTDDEDQPPVPTNSSSTILSSASDSNTGSSTKRFFRMVDKITTSKYFQQISDYKYVKRAMEGLSNTDIKLEVELCGLEGRLVMNMPPPPHDRLWFGFRSNPRLVLKAKPAVGTRSVRFAHITKWIEEKLCKEFEKILVLPNMEDITFEVMTPTPIKSE